jgi:hypothetical protein
MDIDKAGASLARARCTQKFKSRLFAPRHATDAQHKCENYTLVNRPCNNEVAVMAANTPKTMSSRLMTMKVRVRILFGATIAHNKTVHAALCT